MSKRILQDVVTSSSPQSGRRVRESDTKKKIDSRSELDVRMPSSNRIQMDSDTDNGSTGFSKFAIWGVAAAAVLFLLFVLLQFFSGTVVEVVPMQKNVTIDANFIAYKKAEESDLSFKLITLERSQSGEVTATGEKDIERKASGDIIIYNSYSSNSQKLIKRTRFETPDGKIYRINKSVVVPGTTVQNGKIIPGSIEVTVYADIPGDEYNIDLTDFTIPGFKGDPRFDKFYARSKTIIGDGFSGTIKVASPEDVSDVKEDLQNSLKETLSTQAHSQVPGDFILYNNAVFFSFDDVKNQEETKKDTINVTEKGTLYGVLFNKKELSKHLASNSVSTYDGSDVLATGLEELKFNVIDSDQFDPTVDTELKFTILGPTKIIWDVNETALVRDLVGVSKVDFLNVIGGYPNIQRAEAILKPFWKKVFPENSEDITIRKIDQVDSI